MASNDAGKMSVGRRSPGDLRAWLKQIESIKALKRVNGADDTLDIGTITELNNAMARPKALLFENIPGKVGRVLTSSASSSETLAITLGLQPSSTSELIDYLRGGRMSGWVECARKKKFEWKRNAPVLENVKIGDGINLRCFPAPKWREEDGGRYIGTGCVVITQDPVDGSFNGGAYRVMLLDDRRVTVMMASETRHGRQHQRKWQEKGLRCPVVISLGHDPLFAILSGMEIPDGVFELDVASAVLGQTSEMVPGQVTGLPVPAHAEFVLEGWISDDCESEGPFGEFLGYYSGGNRSANVVDVEAVYFRGNPIVLGSPPGKPPHDLSYYYSVMRSALIQDQITSAGVPGIKGVWADEVGGARQFITVSLQQRYIGHSRQVALIASQCQASIYLGRYVVVVDEDIDPTNLREVIWAVATRTDPSKDILTFDGSLGGHADPMKLAYERGGLRSSRGIIDACIPFEHRENFPRVASTPPAELRATRTKWSHIWDD